MHLLTDAGSIAFTYSSAESNSNTPANSFTDARTNSRTNSCTHSRAEHIPALACADALAVAIADTVTDSYAHTVAIDTDTDQIADAIPDTNPDDRSDNATSHSVADAFSNRDTVTLADAVSVSVSDAHAFTCTEHACPEWQKMRGFAVVDMGEVFTAMWRRTKAPHKAHHHAADS